MFLTTAELIRLTGINERQNKKATNTAIKKALDSMQFKYIENIKGEPIVTEEYVNMRCRGQESETIAEPDFSGLTI